MNLKAIGVCAGTLIVFAIVSSLIGTLLIADATMRLVVGMLSGMLFGFVLIAEYIYLESRL